MTAAYCACNCCAAGLFWDAHGAAGGVWSLSVCLLGVDWRACLLCLCLLLFQRNRAVSWQWVCRWQQLFSSTVTALAQVPHRHLFRGGVAWLAMQVLAAVLVATGRGRHCMLSLLVACGLCGTSILRRLAVLNASAVHDSQKTTHTIVLNTEPNSRPCRIADASTLMCWWLLRCCWPFPHMQWQVWQWGLCRHRGDIYSLMMVFWAVGCAVMVQCPGWLL